MKSSDELQTATFGAGCFWGVEALYKKLPGVITTKVGYMGGHTSEPTYPEVCSGSTGHAEVVQIDYDPTIISYSELIEYFWRLHDPTTPNQQGPNIGTQYRSVIYYHSEQQRQQAQSSKLTLQKKQIYNAPIITEITAAEKFYPAEQYHQNYYEKNQGPVCHTLKPKF